MCQKVRKERMETLYKGAIKKTRRENPYFDILDNKEKKELVDQSFKDLITSDFYNIF